MSVIVSNEQTTYPEKLKKISSWFLKKEIYYYTSLIIQMRFLNPFDLT